MTVTQLAAIVGKTAWMRPVPKLLFAVKILDARTRFGHTDYLVSPISGSGETWVESTNISIWED